MLDGFLDVSISQYLENRIEISSCMMFMAAFTFLRTGRKEHNKAPRMKAGGSGHHTFKSGRLPVTR